jgi:hypothetical protein
MTFHEISYVFISVHSSIKMSISAIVSVNRSLDNLPDPDQKVGPEVGPKC